MQYTHKQTQIKQTGQNINLRDEYTAISYEYSLNFSMFEIFHNKKLGKFNKVVK